MIERLVVERIIRRARMIGRRRFDRRDDHGLGVSAGSGRRASLSAGERVVPVPSLACRVASEALRAPGRGDCLAGVRCGALALRRDRAPHVFINCGVDLLFSGDRIDGLRLTWTFDDMFSGFIVQEFDRDRNGSLSPAEIHQIEVKHLAEFRRVKFFTVVTLNGQDVTPGPVRDFTAAVAKGLVTYQFTLPFSAPLASTTAIEVVVDDPTYYIAYLATAASPQSQTVGGLRGGVPRGPRQDRCDA